MREEREPIGLNTEAQTRLAVWVSGLMKEQNKKYRPNVGTKGCACKSLQALLGKLLMRYSCNQVLSEFTKKETGNNGDTNSGTTR